MSDTIKRLSLRDNFANRGIKPGQKLSLFGITIISFLIPGWAQSAPCENFKSTQEVLNCAVARHPAIGISSLAAKQGLQGEAVAKQRPNPEFNSQTLFGGETNDQFVSEFNLAFTLELGGKRDSRIKKAEAELKLNQALHVRSRDDVFLTTLRSLYRLRQIQDELSAIDDALNTFARIGKQYRSRARLNPEQKASLRIFEVAEQDYRMRRASFESENFLHLQEIEFALGQRYAPTFGVLPKRYRTWPALPGSPSQPDGGSRLLEAEAEAASAEADLATATSNAWPDLKIGPSVILQRQSSQSFKSYGFNLAVPLPLFHRNAAGEAFARTGSERALLSLQTIKSQVTSQKSYLQARYENAVRVLTQSASASDLLKKHEEVESLFAQGFLNGTAVVEIHRQFLDFIKTQNEQELAAIESLVQYHALDGKPFEVKE